MKKPVLMKIKQQRPSPWLLAVPVAAVLLWFQLEQSCTAASRIFARSVGINAANVLVVLWLMSLLALLTARWGAAVLVTSAAIGVLGIVNFYVLLFHGKPLSSSDFATAGTAADVLGGYTLPVGRAVVTSAVCLAVGAAVGVLLWKKLGRTGRSPLLTVLTVALTAAAGWNLLGGGTVAQLKADACDYREQAARYGYAVAFGNDAVRSRRICTAPEGYSEEEVQGWANERTPKLFTISDAPDIILILNETFYDLDDYLDTQSDRAPLAEFYAVEGALHGHAVSPYLGGGTNDSEYELLTGNSVQLLNFASPFMKLPLQNANSAVNYLESLGYETWGMHPADGENYNRRAAYNALGFDHVLFEQDFAHYESYGSRRQLDSANYQDLIAQYEAGGDAPRFMYLLTYQNHGGWEQNPPELDTVHTGRADLGKAVTEQLNEYQSSVALSGDAFAALTEYFSAVERPVVVCMVGDHAPSFINDLPAPDGLTAEEAALLQHSTPLVIWANFPLNAQQPGCISMTEVFPTVLRAAGLPLSEYHRTLLELSETAPARLPYGLYRTAGGTLVRRGENALLDERLQRYLSMEYNNLTGGGAAALFVPEG